MVCWVGGGLTLVQRWTSVRPTLVRRIVSAGVSKGPFPLVRFNPWTRAGTRAGAIFSSLLFLNPCIISIHAEPARVICRAGRESNNVRFFPHRMAKTHGEFQKKTSHRWVFPCIAACFSKFVRISLTWTYNHLIICKYGKRNPIFSTIKDEQEMCGRKFLRN